MPMFIIHMHVPSLLWLSTADLQHCVFHPCWPQWHLMPAWRCHREVVNNLELAARLGVQAHPNAKHDNFVDESVQIGSKSTVAAGCMVGPGATLA